MRVFPSRRVPLVWDCRKGAARKGEARQGLTHNVCLIYGPHVNIIRLLNHANNVLMSRSCDAQEYSEKDYPEFQHRLRNKGASLRLAVKGE